MKLRPSQNIVTLREALDLRRLAHDLRRTRQAVGSKPRGLWYACGDAWLRVGEEWGEGAWDGIIPPFTYEVDLDPSRFVLISSARAMKRFQDAYGVTGVGDLDPEWVDIDWRAVARDYDGVRICPAQSAVGAKWYHGWDVASGCVWRKRAIRRFRRVDEAFAGWTLFA